MSRTSKVEDRVICDFPLNPVLTHGFNHVIGFLNDIQSKYPQAISLVAGMPDENFFDLENNLQAFNTYVDYLAGGEPGRRDVLVNKLGQYGSSKGIINEVLVRYLKNDEDIETESRNIIVTVGAQEAFAVIVSTICNREQDVILTEDPGYFGLNSFARIFHYPTEGVRMSEDGIDLDALQAKIGAVTDTGRSVKLLYVIPDYHNPTGCCMTVRKRIALIEMAEKYNFLIIEDSVYNGFSYDKMKQPTLKSLDQAGRVIYVGSFSKLLFPGLRIGMIVAEQRVSIGNGKTTLLIDEMEKAKGLITNNTSTVSQAVLAGILIRHHCSLAEWNQEKIKKYKHKHDIMLQALDKYIGMHADGWAAGISWNRPGGGFFIRVFLPFAITQKDVLECAIHFGVIFCPMSNFYLNGGGEKEIRLTFSNHSPENIEKGISALAAFLQTRSADSRQATVMQDQAEYQ